MFAQVIENANGNQLGVIRVLNGEGGTHFIDLTTRKTLLAFVLGQTCAILKTANKQGMKSFIHYVNTKFPLDTTSLMVIANQTFDFYSLLTSGDREILLTRECSPFLAYTQMPHMDVFNLLSKYATSDNANEIHALRVMYNAYVGEIKDYFNAGE